MSPLSSVGHSASSTIHHGLTIDGKLNQNDHKYISAAVILHSPIESCGLLHSDYYI